MKTDGLKTDTHNTPGKMRYVIPGVIFAIAIVVSVFIYTSGILTKTDTGATIRIPENASAKMVADSLSRHFGESFSYKTIRLMKLMHTDFTKRHGAYHITQGTTVFGVARKLCNGAQTPVKITINGFRNKDLMLEKISAKLDFSADSLRAKLYDTAFLSPYGLNPDNATALFLDDTYEVYWSSSPQSVLNKIGQNYLNFWTEERKKKASAMGLSPAEVMIIASITDEETNNLSEKGTIGRLYNNRKQKGMRLQSDPTVRYALNDFSIRRVKGEHLNINSPYNTYRNAGLPPGPIRTTSKQTVDAILNSEPNEYLYMCAKEDFSGTHNFASTYAEHSRNARRYQKALNDRNIY